MLLPSCKELIYDAVEKSVVLRGWVDCPMLALFHKNDEEVQNVMGCPLEAGCRFWIRLFLSTRSLR